jgi:hypothetical protein
VQRGEGSKAMTTGSMWVAADLVWGTGTGDKDDKEDGRAATSEVVRWQSPTASVGEPEGDNDQTRLAPAAMGPYEV